jgi:hypothetical protein
MKVLPTNANFCCLSCGYPFWSNIVFGKGLAPTIFFDVHDSCTQRSFLSKRRANNEFCGGSSNNNFDSRIGVIFKM